MLIIFDADGTLTPYRDGSNGPFTAELLPGVAAVCAGLRAAGHVLAIASNQSRRRPRDEIVRQLRWTQRQIGAAAVRWAAREERKKPAPAMLAELARQFGVLPEEVLFVGDMATDRAAAEAFGCAFEWADEFFGRRA